MLAGAAAGHRVSGTDAYAVSSYAEAGGTGQGRGDRACATITDTHAHDIHRNGNIRNG